MNEALPKYVNETWLQKMAGWQAVKHARGLVAHDFKVHFDQGWWIGSWGSEKTRMVCRVKSDSENDVEVKCSCSLGRQGMFCEHAVACLLSVLKPVSSRLKPALIVEKKDEEWPNFEHKTMGQYSIYVRVVNHERILFLTQYHQQGEESSVWASCMTHLGKAHQSTMLEWSGHQAYQALTALVGHPRVYSGTPQQYQVINISDQSQSSMIEVVPMDAEHLKLCIKQPWKKWLSKADWVAWSNGEEVVVLRSAAKEGQDLLVEISQHGQAVRTMDWWFAGSQLIAAMGEITVDSELQGLSALQAIPQIGILLDGDWKKIQLRLFVIKDEQMEQVPLDELQYEKWKRKGYWDVKQKQYYYWDTKNLEKLKSQLEVIDFKVNDGFWVLTGEKNTMNFYSRYYSSWLKAYQIEAGITWKKNCATVHLVKPKIQSQPLSLNTEMKAGVDDWIHFDFKYQAQDGYQLPRTEVLRLLSVGQTNKPLSNRGQKYLLDVAEIEGLESKMKDVDVTLASDKLILQSQHLHYFGVNRDAFTEVNDKVLEDQILSSSVQVRSYQIEGVKWLCSQSHQGKGALLADDMGLGKTLQTILWMKYLRVQFNTNAPILIVCPTSLLFNWQDELQRFALDLKVRWWQTGAADHLESTDVFLISYHLVWRRIDELKMINWQVLVMDEASLIRNPDTEAAKALRQLRAQHKVALTGTPIENSARDLWSIFAVIQPLYLGERKVFEERFCQKEKESSVILTNQGDSLRALISPFAKRRVKEEVLKELPQKIETVIWSEMTGLQKKYYQQLVEEGLVKLTSLRAQKKPLLFQNSVLTLLLRLRQVACDLRLVQPELVEHHLPTELSGKWQLFLDKVEQTKDEGGKVLFFSQFVQTLQMFKSELERQQLNFAYLDGSTRDRADQVKYFQENDACSFFLISLKSGAYGLNLTAADQVVIIDPWWNPTVEAQAIDRAHRFGQRKVVNAMRWVSVGTIEEKIQRLQVHKLNLQKGIFDHEQNLPLKMDEDELIQWISSSSKNDSIAK